MTPKKEIFIHVFLALFITLSFISKANFNIEILITLIPIIILTYGLWTAAQSHSISTALHYVRSITLLIILFATTSFFKYSLSKDLTASIEKWIDCNNIMELRYFLLFSMLIASTISILTILSYTFLAINIKKLIFHYLKSYPNKKQSNILEMKRYLAEPYNDYAQAENPSIQMAISISETLILLLAFSQIATAPEIEIIRNSLPSFTVENCNDGKIQFEQLIQNYTVLLSSPAIVFAEIYASLQLLTAISKADLIPTQEDTKVNSQTLNTITRYFRSLLTNQPINWYLHPFIVFILIFILIAFAICALQSFTPYIRTAPFFSFHISILAAGAYIVNRSPNTNTIKYTILKNRTKKRIRTSHFFKLR